MLPFTTAVIIRGGGGGGNLLKKKKSNIKYIFCNKHFKAFLDGQMSKDTPTPFLAIKNLLF